MIMKNVLKLLYVTVCSLFFIACLDEHQNKQIIDKCNGKASLSAALNPIVPPGMYIADPEVRQMPGGRIFLYGSRDEPGNSWCSESYNVMSTLDLKRWDVEQCSFATQGLGKQTNYTEDILYAPDCIFHEGKYYLYYCLATGGEDEGVAVSDSPYGPFKNGQAIKGINGIDPSVFIDDDGQAYLFWGQLHARGAKLGKDMRTIEGAIHDSLLTSDEHFFHEGGSMRKINGTYYYVYAGSPRHGKNNCATLCYATSKSVFGPYTYRGVIIDNFGSDKNLVNNHGSIVEINGQWYVFYHRPSGGMRTGTLRKACVEPIYFNEDGTIQEAEMTTQGAGGPMSPLIRMEASRACLLSGNLTVKIRRPEHDIPVEYLADIHDGDYAFWKYYDFDASPVTHFICKTWGKNLASQIEVRLDSPEGELLGTCQLKEMNGEVAYSVHETAVKSPKGKRSVVLVFKSFNGEKLSNQNLMNLEWFTFENRS